MVMLGTPGSRKKPSADGSAEWLMGKYLPRQPD